MSEKSRISTATVDPVRRLDFWRSMLADSHAPGDLAKCVATDFEGQMVVQEVDRLTITRMESAPHTFVRPFSQIKSSHSDHYVAAIQLQTGIRYSMNGREGVTEAGSVTLYDMGRPFVCESVDWCSSCDIHIPRDIFERVLGPTTSAAGLTIGPSQANASIIRSFFTELFERGHLLAPMTAKRMASIGVDLLAACFAEQLACEPRTSVGSATLAFRAKMFVEEHLGDFALDTAMIATYLGLSVRRLQEVFTEQKLAVGEYIWARRVVKACERLCDPAYDANSVADIGYSVGFRSPAHFARRFRQHYDTSPSSYRTLSAELRTSSQFSRARRGIARS